MILIEEDEDRVGEESCTENNNEDAYKENKNFSNKTKTKSDFMSKPRALNKKDDHGIKIEVMRDERVANHLKKEPTEALNLMFYDFNNSTG